MQNITLEQRAEWYTKAFKKFPPIRIWNGRIEDVWFLGRDYTNVSSYYGAYPSGYLKRMNALFQEKKKVLHLFSGSLPPGDYTRFDRRPEMNPDVLGDANQLSKYFNKKSFDMIFADPPYTEEDANKYGTTLISRVKVIEQAYDLLEVGGHLVWLDQIWPMYSKTRFAMEGGIAIVISTNHRVRMATVFKKVKRGLIK